jgi:hypothetical protein
METIKRQTSEYFPKHQIGKWSKHMIIWYSKGQEQESGQHKLIELVFLYPYDRSV